MKATTKQTEIEWHILDAKDDVLGRLATKAAHLLMGKHRTDYASNTVAPVYVVVLNTDSVRLTGKKAEQKEYYRYSGYSGGLKTRTFAEHMKRDSRFVVEQAVFGMLPKNNLRDDLMRRLKLYPTAEHPHMAQASDKKN